MDEQSEEHRKIVSQIDQLIDSSVSEPSVSEPTVSEGSWDAAPPIMVPIDTIVHKVTDGCIVQFTSDRVDPKHARVITEWFKSHGLNVLVVILYPGSLLDLKTRREFLEEAP